MPWGILPIHGGFPGLSPLHWGPPHFQISDPTGKGHQIQTSKDMIVQQIKGTIQGQYLHTKENIVHNILPLAAPSPTHVLSPWFLFISCVCVCPRSLPLCVAPALSHTSAPIHYSLQYTACTHMYMCPPYSTVLHFSAWASCTISLHYMRRPKFRQFLPDGRVADVGRGNSGAPYG